MNAKVFSIIAGVLVIVLAVLGGTYYYLFEYKKPSYNYQSYNSNSSNLNENLNLNTQNETKEKEMLDLPKPNLEQDKPSLEQNLSNEPTITQPLNNENNESKKDLTENEKSSSKEKSSLNDEKSAFSIKKLKDENENKPAKQVRQSTIKEYQQKGRDSRYEPALSSEFVKVYVMDGKQLTNYRIGLLKDMFEPVHSRASDYNLTIFIKMLPKNQMNVSIYNKDIIFSNKKKSYKYITLKHLEPFLSDLENINSKVKREEIIQRMQFQNNDKSKGSDFARHIKSLKAGLFTAQFFFPFSEIIEITPLKK